MASSKDILLTNFTRFDLKAVEALIVKHNLFNIYVKLPADAIDEKTMGLIIRYGLNLIVPVECVEKGRDSIQQIMLRNPKFLTSIEECPPQKIFFLRESTESMGLDSIVTLASNYKNTVLVMRTPTGPCMYYDERELLGQYNQQLAEEGLEELVNIQFMDSMEGHFDFLDYGLMKNIGIIGDRECILLTS